MQDQAEAAGVRCEAGEDGCGVGRVAQHAAVSQLQRRAACGCSLARCACGGVMAQAKAAVAVAEQRASDTALQSVSAAVEAAAETERTR